MVAAACKEIDCDREAGGGESPPKGAELPSPFVAAEEFMLLLVDDEEGDRKLRSGAIERRAPSREKDKGPGNVLLNQDHQAELNGVNGRCGWRLGTYLPNPPNLGMLS